MSPKSIQLPEIPDLACRLDELIRQIPAGRVATCGMLADALGDISASRWIGSYTLHHACAEEGNADCPCHRVVRAGGKLGGFARGDELEKSQRLIDEGIELAPEGLDLALYGFTNFQTDYPMKTLARFQKELGDRIVDDRCLPSLQETLADCATGDEDLGLDLIGAVDVSYFRTGSSETGQEFAAATYVLYSLKERRPIWCATLIRPVWFPYITGYLAFRELPPYIDLLSRVRDFDRLAPVVMVDGSGRLHPRRSGIACNLGVVADVATIGVTKKLLVGRVDTSETIESGKSVAIFDSDGVEFGRAFKSSPRSKRLIYVSVGHGLDLATADWLVRASLAGHRLVEPIRWADRLSRQAATETKSAAITQPKKFDPTAVTFHATELDAADIK